jgi:hypothetical protein
MPTFWNSQMVDKSQVLSSCRSTTNGITILSLLAGMMAPRKNVTPDGITDSNRPQ